MSNGPLKKCWACGEYYVVEPQVWAKINGETKPVRKIRDGEVMVPLCPSCLRLSLLSQHLTGDIRIDWEKELSGRNGEEGKNNETD